MGSEAVQLPGVIGLIFILTFTLQASRGKEYIIIIVIAILQGMGWVGAGGGSDGCPGGGRERDREMRDRAGGRGQEGREAGKDEGDQVAKLLIHLYHEWKWTQKKVRIKWLALCSVPEYEYDGLHQEDPVYMETHHPAV